MLGILRGPREHAHLADVQVAQDLRADAVVAQVHLGFRARLIGDCALAQFQRRLGTMQQHEHAALGARDPRPAPPESSTNATRLS